MLIVGGIIGVTFLVARPIKAEIDSRMLELRAQAITEIETRIGRSISYETIAPSIFRYIEIRGLAVYGRLGEPEQLIEVDRLKVYYSLLSILRGDLQNAFTEVRIENTTFAFDQRRDDDVTALVRELLSGSNGEETTLPDRLVVSGRNLGASLWIGGAEVQLSEVEFRSVIRGSTVDVELDSAVAIRATRDGVALESATGTLRADGIYNLADGTAIADLEIPQLGTNLATITNQRFQVRYDGEAIEARKTRDRAPVDFFARIQLEPFRLYASVLADAYAPIDLVQLAGPYEQVNRWLAYPMSGQASILVTDREVSYSGSLFTSLTEADPLPDGDVTVRFSGTPTLLTFSELDYDSEYGLASFSGDLPLNTLRPTGTVELLGVSYAGINPVWLTASVESQRDTVRITTQNVFYGGTYIGFLHATVGLGEERSADLSVTFDRSGRRRMDLSADLGEQWQILGGTAMLSNIDPREVLALEDALGPSFELPSYVSRVPENLEIDADLTFNVAEQVTIEAPFVSVVDVEDPSTYGSFSLTYSRDEIRVDDLFVGYDDYEGSGRFTANLIEGERIAFDSDISVEQIDYQVRGIYSPEGRLELSGLYDIEAVFDFQNPEVVTFDVTGDIPLPLREGLDSGVAFDLNGYYTSLEEWGITINDLFARGLPYYTVEAASVRLSGSASPQGAEFSRLDYADGFSELSGSGRAQWSIEERRIAADVELASEAIGERYIASIVYAEEKIDLQADVERSPISRFGIDLISGAISGSLDLSGPTDALSIEARGSLLDGVFDEEPLSATASIAITPRSARLTDGTLEYAGTLVNGVAGTVSLDSRKAQLVGSVLFGGQEAIDVDAQADLNGDLPTLAEVIDAPFDAIVVLDNLPTNEPLPRRWVFEARREGDQIAFDGGPEQSIAGTVTLDGRFTADVARPIPIAFRADGRLVDGLLEADLTRVDADVPRLFALSGTPGVEFLSAETSGSLRIAGSIVDPDFYGTLAVTNLTGTVEQIAGVIGPARTFLVFEEKVATVRRTIATVAPGSAQISAVFTMNRWLPESFRINVTIAEGESIPIVYDFGGVAVDGLARGSLVVEGDAGATSISGDVVGSATSITLTEVPEADLGDDDFELLVDVTVRTGRGMEFLWPSTAFPILRGSAATGESVRITHNSRTGALAVRGDVEIQGGEVFYFDRSFYVRSGTISFDEDELEFDPVLSVVAEIREVNEDGPVRISLVVEDDPLSLFTPRWESNPGMTETEILALLGGSVFSREPGEEIDLSQVAQLTGDVVSQIAIVQNLEASVREALQLDLFSLRTQVVGNLIGQLIDSGQYPLDTSVPSLGKYLDNTTLFLGKYLGTDLFLELLVQLRADDPLSTTTQSLTGLSVESELSLEWQTPFFLLQWSLAPDDPASLWLTDNTVSFSWEYSY